MNASTDLYLSERLLLMTLDPVHIGTGGQRLGRVDMSIVREPGTRLPKIPGTSLSGAIRQYAAYRYERLRCAGAGQGEGDKGHCREETCPVCYTFGYLRGAEGGQSGKVSISDARLLLFPVYSHAGPIWITCPSVMNEFDVLVDDPGEKVRASKVLCDDSHLNLGWLMLEHDSETTFQWPKTITGLPMLITERVALVSDRVFSQIVNSNLEVRTSVSIDPVTGAAADSALFTYEAIPRTAVMWMDIVEDDFRRAFPIDHEMAVRMGHSRPLDVVKSGLALAEYLGVGGMGTRGFGRVRLLVSEVEKNDNTQPR